MEKLQMTFLRVHYFAVMVTGMHFLKEYFYESQVDI